MKLTDFLANLTVEQIDQAASHAALVVVGTIVCLGLVSVIGGLLLHHFIVKPYERRREASRKEYLSRLQSNIVSFRRD